RSIYIQVLKVANVLPMGLIKTNDQIKPSFSFKHIAQNFSTKSHTDDLIKILDVQAITGNLFPVVRHVHLRQTFYFLNSYIGGTFNLLYQLFDFLGFST